MADGYKFYSEGKEIGKDEFIQIYSQQYYSMYPDVELESKISHILSHAELTAGDIQEILCWKIPARKSDTGTTVIHNRFPQRMINAEDVKKCIPETISKTDEAITEVLKKLTEIKYTGPVYAITVLYFATRGFYPIYDRFAHIALKKITEQTDFKVLIPQKSLEAEFHANWQTPRWYQEYKNNYIGRLQNVFGDKYRTDRDIDRALWVYGHLFNDNKRNKERTN